MFYIRADANKEIATGHVMRCISIAGELKKRGIDTTFITADHQADELIRARGYDTICLNSVWNDLEAEISDMKEVIVRNSIDKVLLDSYYATDRYLEELSKMAKVIYVDDLGELTYPVDKIINYNIYGPKIDYVGVTGSASNNLLLSPAYAPLREEFQIITPVFREQVKKVLVSTGGADKYNIAGKFLERIMLNESFKGIEFCVVSGKMNTNYKNLIVLAEQSDNIHIYSNVTKMSELMCQCDIAISGCGSTMYELCRCGLPILTFSFADNQIAGAEAFGEAEVAINCGDARDGMEQLIKTIEESLLSLISNTMLRRSMFEKATCLVDGQGVKRLVDEILRG